MSVTLHINLFQWQVSDWVFYLHVVSSSERTSVHGSRRSFLFLEKRVCVLSSVLVSQGLSGSPHYEPHTLRSHLWFLCGNPTSSLAPVPSSSPQILLSLLPVVLPPSPSSLPVIVPAEAGRGQLSLAQRGKRQFHSLCCCWCQGVKVSQCSTGQEWRKPEKRIFDWLYLKTFLLAIWWV